MSNFRLSDPAGQPRSKCAHTALRKALSWMLSIAVTFIFTSPVPAATYAGTNTGAIPDGTTVCGTPRDILFNVSGFAGSVGSVSASFTMSPLHTFAGDLQVTLLAPNGTSHLLFSRIGSNTAGDPGDSANFDGTYTFNDIATSNIWTVAASNGSTNFQLTNTSYRTQAAGPSPTDSPGPAFTSMNAAFASVPPASVNGTWTLRFEDCASTDTGSVSAASLTLISTSAASASVTGRVTTSYGSGIRNVMVVATGGGLVDPKVTYTGALGYYRFDGLEAGQSYVISVAAKRYVFEQPAMLLNLDQNVDGLNFVSLQ